MATTSEATAPPTLDAAVTAQHVDVFARTDLVPRSVQSDFGTAGADSHNTSEHRLLTQAEASHLLNRMTHDTVDIDFSGDTSFTVEFIQHDGKVKEIVARFESFRSGDGSDESYSDDPDTNADHREDAGTHTYNTKASQSFEADVNGANGQYHTVNTETAHLTYDEVEHGTSGRIGNTKIILKEHPELPSPSKDISQHSPRKPIPFVWAPMLKTAQRAIERESRKKASQPDLRNAAAGKTVRGRGTAETKPQPGDSTTFLTKDAIAAVESVITTPTVPDKNSGTRQPTLKSTLRTPDGSPVRKRGRANSTVKITVSPNRTSRPSIQSSRSLRNSIPPGEGENVQPRSGLRLRTDAPSLPARGSPASGKARIPGFSMHPGRIETAVAEDDASPTRTRGKSDLSTNSPTSRSMIPNRLTLRIPNSVCQHTSNRTSGSNGSPIAPSKASPQTSKIPRITTSIKAHRVQADNPVDLHAVGTSDFGENKEDGRESQDQILRGFHPSSTEMRSEQGNGHSDPPKEAHQPGGGSNLNGDLPELEEAEPGHGWDGSEPEPFSIPLPQNPTSTVPEPVTEVDASLERFPDTDFSGFGSFTDESAIKIDAEEQKEKQFMEESEEEQLTKVYIPTPRVTTSPVSVKECDAVRHDGEGWINGSGEINRDAEEQEREQSTRVSTPLPNATPIPETWPQHDEWNGVRHNSGCWIIGSREEMGSERADSDVTVTDEFKDEVLADPAVISCRRKSDSGNESSTASVDCSTTEKKPIQFLFQGVDCTKIETSPDSGRSFELRATAPVFVPTTQQANSIFTPPSLPADIAQSIYQLYPPMVDPFFTSPTLSPASNQYTFGTFPGLGGRRRKSPKKKAGNRSWKHTPQYSQSTNASPTPFQPSPGLFKQVEESHDRLNAAIDNEQKTRELDAQGTDPAAFAYQFADVAALTATVFGPRQPEQVNMSTEQHFLPRLVHKGAPKFNNGGLSYSQTSPRRGRNPFRQYGGNGLYDGPGSNAYPYNNSAKGVPLSSVPFPAPIEPMARGPRISTVSGGSPKEYVGYAIAAEPCGAIEIEQAMEFGNAKCHNCDPW
ncbi:hypothetical protein GQ43DRAFT_468096 [Delitschia confertaspora ATCC 74209]|uniref:Uncharacterized protein n=1 Tax=Delitschia confertaspora ATCC 74209 TaxID=1513339 RepID=A0A9P4JUU0_9PLEO|nr:hypothetical protein GQ43DRAFT_468096 [Delitschia confertaspora ATCC 74209]